MEKKWECNDIVDQLFIDIKEAHDSGDMHFTTFSMNMVYSQN